jgi:hypothetical protein
VFSRADVKQRETGKPSRRWKQDFYAGTGIRLSNLLIRKDNTQKNIVLEPNVTLLW